MKEEVRSKFNFYRFFKIKLFVRSRMEANGVNYYKGVLLCSRPNESPSVQTDKPFCGRVTPHDALGLVPTKKFDQPQIRKRNLPILNNHKKWLESFKKKIVEKKQIEEEAKIKEIQKLEKIKEEGYKKREEQKKSMAASIQNASAVPEEKSAQLFMEKKRQGKKGVKPGWAKSQKQREQQEEKQVDDLLDFFENDELKDYLADEQVTKMLTQLKGRIEQMKKEGEENTGNWKKKQVDRIQEAKAQQSEKDDILSRISRNSEARSVTSQKTVERVQQLEKKKQQKEWDKYTATDKRSQASLDGQIAKNVADQVLRNYPALKHHSNQSIRKLLEMQARQQIKE